jgi:CBS domain-containing protein
MAGRTVRDWMSSPAVTVADDTQLAEVRQRMADHGVRRLPVVSAEGRLVGIVTQNDVYRISASHVTDVQDYDLYSTRGHLPARRFMSATPLTASPDESVVEAARRMLAHKISGLPVVSAEGQIVGMITESNIFRVLIERSDELGNE